LLWKLSRHHGLESDGHLHGDQRYQTHYHFWRSSCLDEAAQTLAI
jgi:hypothetical protein